LTRQPESARDRIDRLLDFGLRIAVAALLLEVLGHVGNEWILDGRVANLDVGEEGNAPTWASSVATFTAAFAALLLLLAEGRARLGLLGLAALLAWFSLDDIIQAHERVSGKLDVLESLPDYVRTRLWLPVYLPLLAVAGYLLFRAAAEAPARAARFIRAGLLLLVAGIAFEVVGLATKWLARRDVVWPDDIRIGLEEGIELSGWILVATGLTAAALSAWLGLRDADQRAEGHEHAARPQPPATAGERERGSQPRRDRA
jgi:hypothetical protein